MNAGLNVAVFTDTYRGAMRELDRIAADPAAVFYGAYGEAIENVAAIFAKGVDEVVCDIQTWRAALIVAPAPEHRGAVYKGQGTEPYDSGFGRCVR